MTKEEYIKERNELAKQIYISANALTPQESLYRADRWMQDMYGFNLEKFGHSEQTNHIVSIAEKDGIKGVRVQALGEDFVIGLHDLDNGKIDFKYDEAMIRLKELNLSTFNRIQAAIVCIYLDEINEKLIEAGGDKFAEDWYMTDELSSSDYIENYPWYFVGHLGCLDISSRCETYFRCRPIF